MNYEKERKEFEDWTYLGQTEVEPDELNEQEVNFAWEAWKARANLCKKEQQT